METFLQKYKHKVEQEIKLLFLPKIAKATLFGIFMRNALNCATIQQLTLRKVEILEYADNDTDSYRYKVKLNHDMEITFVLGIKTEKEVSNG